MNVKPNSSHPGRIPRITKCRPQAIHPGIIMLLLLFSAAGCPQPLQIPASWNALVNKNAAYTGKTGSWEGYNELGDPGMYYEFADHGLRLDYVHPEYFTQINDDGSLTAPGYQDPGHQGQASIDYTQLLDLCDGFRQHGVDICIGLFVHNFETVSVNGLTTFLKNWSTDLKNLGVDSIIFVPAWEIQGQWAAWPQGATRDCYIDPTIFNDQMAVFHSAVDAANASVPAGAVITLGAVAGGWTTNPFFNSFGYTAMDYLPGLRLADWVGLDYYPVKAGTPGGPEDALADAAAYYQALGTNAVFGLAEYSLNNDPATGGVSGWSENDKVDFIETTYNRLLSTYPMITFIHWWFIGQGPTNGRIHFQ